MSETDTNGFFRKLPEFYKQIYRQRGIQRFVQEGMVKSGLGTVTQWSGFTDTGEPVGGFFGEMQAALDAAEKAKSSNPQDLELQSILLTSGGEVGPNREQSHLARLNGRIVEGNETVNLAVEINTVNHNIFDKARTYLFNQTNDSRFRIGFVDFQSNEGFPVSVSIQEIDSDGWEVKAFRYSIKTTLRACLGILPKSVRGLLTEQQLNAEVQLDVFCDYNNKKGTTKDIYVDPICYFSLKLPKSTYQALTGSDGSVLDGLKRETPRLLKEDFSPASDLFTAYQCFVVNREHVELLANLTATFEKALDARISQLKANGESKLDRPSTDL